MADKEQNITVNEKFLRAVKLFHKLTEGELSTGRKDSLSYQNQIKKAIEEFKSINTISDNLGLFSVNEGISEMSVKYIPFLNVHYYLGVLFQGFLGNPRTKGDAEDIDIIEHKEENLTTAKTCIIKYLASLENYGVLSEKQARKLNSWSDLYNPTMEELAAFESNPAMKREEKIENYRLEKQLGEKLKILESIYSEDDADDTDFGNLDEETVRAIFKDQLVLFSLRSFSMLEQILMELQVLSKRPKNHKRIEEIDTRKEEAPSADNDYGFTNRLETLPFKKEGISSFLSKDGKILRPFRIEPNREELKKKVFGTGQVLPSMTPEEYLEYELANGKMLKQEPTQVNEDRDTDDSDEELEKRRWDDWKDDNPKGSGNMKANIG